MDNDNDPLEFFNQGWPKVDYDTVIVDDDTACWTPIGEIGASTQRKDSGVSRSLCRRTESWNLLRLIESRSIRLVAESRGVRLVAESRSVRLVAESRSVRLVAESRSWDRIIESMDQYRYPNTNDLCSTSDTTDQQRLFNVEGNNWFAVSKCWCRLSDVTCRCYPAESRSCRRFPEAKTGTPICNVKATL
ncbi:hypothetical protein BGX33_009959 [Mortierella sp. NVP41]|nr:hypothetical protein BGX33_009959 [Mortierella sp. NVP41]